MNNIKYYGNGSSSLLAIAGPDTQKFLQSLITIDVEAILEGHFYPSALLNAQGKIMFDFLITNYKNIFYLAIKTPYKDDFLKRLNMYKLRSNVELIEHDSEHIIVNSQENYGFCDSRFLPLNIRHIYKILEPNYAEIKNYNYPTADFNELRIDHGIAEMGQDFLPNTTYPHNINYDVLHGVSFTKGCYIGQEVVARMQHRANIKKRLFIVTAKQNLTTGEDILVNEKSIGAIGTACGAKALAILRLDHLEHATEEEIFTISKPPYFS